MKNKRSTIMLYGLNNRVLKMLFSKLSGIECISSFKKEKKIYFPKVFQRINF